jgi:hypothetical protein
VSDCPGSPVLSGPNQSNVTKAPGEALELRANWCVALGTEGEIVTSTWTVAPPTGDDPITLTGDDQDGLETFAVIGNGDSATLYTVTNTVSGRRSPTSPLLTFEHRWDVWVTGPSPAYCEDCQ